MLASRRYLKPSVSFMIFTDKAGGGAQKRKRRKRKPIYEWIRGFSMKIYIKWTQSSQKIRILSST